MNIEAINIILSNNENLLINNRECNDFYISNMLENGEEVPYEQTIIKDKLYANLCLIKLNKSEINKYTNDRLKQNKDITEIEVIFNNGKYVKFDIASNANPFSEVYNNEYQYIYEDTDILGILLSEFNIKYKNNLFI